MQCIGYLNTVTMDNAEILTGEITTLKMQLHITLQEIVDKVSEKAPDYMITTKAKNGSDVRVGVAWIKRKMQSDGTISPEYLSLAIDDPSLPHALNLLAFECEDGAYDVNWKRR